MDYPELLGVLKGKRVAIWTCNTCARLCNNIGGTESSERLADKLAADGVESLDALFARTGAFLEELVLPQVEAGKDILIVGHGAMNSSIVCQVRHLPRAQFWSAGIENCKLMILP